MFSMKVKTIFLLTLAVVYVMAVSGQAQIIINKPGRYEGLIVVSNNSDENTADAGIVVEADSVQLINCRVSGFRYGIVAYGRKNISIYNSHPGGLIAGVRMDGVVSVDVCNNTFTGDGMGLVFNESSENIITNNTINTAFDGIIFDNNSNHNSVGNNTVAVGSHWAIAIRGGSSNNYGCGNMVSGWNGTLTGDAALTGCRENGNRINEEVFAAVEAEERADTFALNGNYPNPFNPETTIGYNLAEAGVVKLAIYDMLGRRVAMLVDGWRSAGSHQVVFNARNLASGTYLYRLETPGFIQMKKMVLQK